MAPDHAGEEAHQETERDGEDHHGELRLAEDGAQHEAVEQIAEQPEQQSGKGDADQKGQIRVAGVDEGNTEKGPQHHHVALGEIDRFRRLVDQNKTQRQQPVDTAVSYPADQQLEYIHGASLPGLILVGVFCVITLRLSEVLHSHQQGMCNRFS